MLILHSFLKLGEGHIVKTGYIFKDHHMFFSPVTKSLCQYFEDFHLSNHMFYDYSFLGKCSVKKLILLG